MKTLENTNIVELQTNMINALSELSGEDVVRAFINQHGTQLLTKDFARTLVEEGYLTESDLDLDAIDEEEEEEEDEDEEFDIDEEYDEDEDEE